MSQDYDPMSAADPLSLMTAGVAPLAPRADAAGNIQPDAAPLSRSFYTADGHTWPYPLFYDSCAKQYPAGAHRIAVYADDGGGPAECTGYPPDRDQYSIHAITREGGAGMAMVQIIDYEPELDAFRPGAAREWAEARDAAGERFISYCSRVNLHRLFVELGGCLWRSPRHFLWIPTLDGHMWSPPELADNILRGWSVDVPSSKIWGNQFGQGGPRGTGKVEWDESSLFLDW